MNNYQITIGYTAVIQVHVKAQNENDAKEIALENFKKQKEKMFGRGVEIADDNYKCDGVLDMSATWDLIY